MILLSENILYISLTPSQTAAARLERCNVYRRQDACIYKLECLCTLRISPWKEVHSSSAPILPETQAQRPEWYTHWHFALTDLPVDSLQLHHHKGLLPLKILHLCRTMQGTSMATPLIAGAAALVRQYFQQGMYPTGAPTPSNQFSPSGPLVKAVLIGGAAGLSGFEPDTGLPLAPPPSFRQGFGRLQLSQSLPLQVFEFPFPCHAAFLLSPGMVEKARRCSMILRQCYDQATMGM